MTDEVISLPEPSHKGTMSLEEALFKRRSVRAYINESIDIGMISQLAWAAQGSSGPRGLRTCPSAGAIFPLSLYIAAGNVRGLSPGLYKYMHAGHGLKRMHAQDILHDISEAALQQEFIRQAQAVLILTAHHGLMTRRYLNRGNRYVLFEAGHASQNVYLQAEALGLGTVAIGAFNDELIKSVLGLGHDEEPLYLMPVGRV